MRSPKKHILWLRFYNENHLIWMISLSWCLQATGKVDAHILCKMHHQQDFAVPPWTRGIVEWWSSPWMEECSLPLVHTWMAGSQNAGIWQPMSITTKKAQRQWSTQAFLLEVFLMHILYHNWNTFHTTCKSKLTALCYILQRTLSAFLL